MMQKEWKGMYIGVCLLSWGWVTANVLRVNLTRLYITVHLFSLFFKYGQRDRDLLARHVCIDVHGVYA